MNTAVAVLFLAGLCAFANAQENPSTNRTFAPSVDLEIGQRAPAFALPDQFSHEHSKGDAQGVEGHGPPFFSLRRLVTLLQVAARAAAGCKAAV